MLKKQNNARLHLLFVLAARDSEFFVIAVLLAIFAYGINIQMKMYNLFLRKDCSRLRYSLILATPNEIAALHKFFFNHIDKNIPLSPKSPLFDKIIEIEDKYGVRIV
jgi:hypothetical protein